MSRADRVYSTLIKRNEEQAQKLPEQARRQVGGNGLRQVSAAALQSSGDQTVNASTVLPWLLHALGAPAALTGLLVPVREAGSMLPQAFLTPLLLRVRHRKWAFVTGALVQAAAVAVMTAVAALGQGLGAGLLIVAALTVFALGRCLCSISSKDVQGRTIPSGERGQINGLATTAAGLVAITLGLGIRFVGGTDLSAGQLAWLLGAGALLWVAVAVIYARIREPDDVDVEPAEPAKGSDDVRSQDGGPEQRRSWFAETWMVLRDDPPFRRFVGVRSLLLVSSLSPPLVVALSLDAGAQALTGLAGFIIASGLAALIGGRVFGSRADRSSRSVLRLGAALASAVILAVVAMVSLPGFTGDTWWGSALFVVAYFSLTLLHTGVRVGRKTYLVDMAEGDRRTTYVAVSNSVLGLVLLLVGGISSALVLLDIRLALLLLAGMGLAGVIAATRLPEVSAGVSS